LWVSPTFSELTFARICEPLNKATRKDSEYTVDQSQAKFWMHSTLKLMLCSEPIMTYPRSDRTNALMLDASTETDSVEGGMGAILTQIDNMANSMQLDMHQNNSSTV
jgi:hypothetical protein